MWRHVSPSNSVSTMVALEDIILILDQIKKKILPIVVGGIFLCIACTDFKSDKSKFNKIF